MSVVQPTAPTDRGASPLLSNNPFRNRLTSQVSPVSPEPSARPVSTNPFLDAAEVNNMATATNYDAVTVDPVDKAATTFSTMEINDHSNELQKTRSHQANGGPRRPNQPYLRGFSNTAGHRPTTSAENQNPRRADPRAELDIFADPYEKPRERAREREPRRNSESSIRDRPAMNPEEERRRRDRKDRETKRAGSKSTKPNKKLDVIDKLDVTSIYGTGLFHHDGPFDACNPHRNRKREKYAPMQAFPKDSINMVMGGSGPVNKKLDYNKFHGYGTEAHRDYNEAAIMEDAPIPISKGPQADGTLIYNSGAREVVHGDESTGLGTSTFLEGAPASRAAIQRRESEYETPQLDERAGLGRKKSLAQKIRGVRPNRDRFASPDGRNGPTSPPLTGQNESGANPFFQDFNGQTQRDNAQIQFEDQPKPSRARAPSSPKRAELVRTNTAESTGGEVSKPTGLLGRMKSLKGGRRPVRRDTNS